MSYDQPTLDQFVERYPEFAETPSADIRRALADAALQVDEDWIEQDFQIAIMTLAAHLLSAAAAGTEASGQDDIKSLRIGPISLTYGSRVSVTDLTTTTYGQLFTVMRYRNVGGPVII